MSIDKTSENQWTITASDPYEFGDDHQPEFGVLTRTKPKTKK